MKKLIIFLTMLALMITPILCFAETTEVTTAAETVTESVTTEAASKTETVTEAADFAFNPANFVSNLKFMVSGMVGIFVVIGLIVIVTIVLNKAMSRRKNQ